MSWQKPWEKIGFFFLNSENCTKFANFWENLAKLLIPQNLIKNLGTYQWLATS
jgi:hypothetical protein